MNFKRKLWWAQHKSNVYKYSTFILLFLIVTISIIYFTYSKFTSKNEMAMYETTVEPFIKNDYFIASYIDGEWSDSIPGKDDGYIVDKVVCDNGATATWNDEEWGINIRNATKKIKCAIYFREPVMVTLNFAGTDYTYIETTTIAEFAEKNSTTFSIKPSTGDLRRNISQDNRFAIWAGCDASYSLRAFIVSSDTFGSIKKLMDDNNDYPATGARACIFNVTCLSPETEIEVYDEEDKKRKKKKLKDLKVGDKVICVNPYTGELEIDEVTYIDYLENKHHNKYDKWYFSDGTIIETVHRHRFYNIEKHDYTYMDEWIVGDHGYNINGETIELVKHEEINEDITHCTLFTKKYNNYFANGMLSGNRHSIKIKFM